ncbi:hypothetical protein AB1Y20_023681 [Prymnesium parvum]|uniref:Uncharacterized protein n=1 Tax=Prymnesium parvum TaxID=97485 RepID=A0AB34JF22_PRYPA
MIRPSTGCDSAWAAVRAWYEQQKSKGVAAEGSHPSLRTSSIVSEELGQQLNCQRSANVKEMEAYFCAAQQPLSP